MQKRSLLSAHPRLTSAIQMFWDIYSKTSIPVLPSQRTGNTGNMKEEVVWASEVIQVSVNMCRALVLPEEFDVEV